MTRFGRSVLAGSALIALCANGPDRTVLPIPAPAFDGKIAENVADATPGTAFRLAAPSDAPNVFLFMSDDVGLAMASTFGGPVPTPNLDRIAQAGVRYNQFHTTGICSPSRAALLTGRNHHDVGFGHLADLPSGFPGYTAEIPRETAPLAEVLKLNGYNTAMFGKTHNVRHADASVAGPFDQWPTGQGFEYFWGIVGGDSDQYEPAIFRGTTRLDDVGAGAPMMEARMASEAIDWVHNQQAAAPDKPFFMYYAPGSTHAPHQAPPEWIARFKGRFDMGWDEMRKLSFARMKQQGVIPASTELTERPEQITAWDSLSPARKAFAARSMEVAAAMLAYQDAQLGRVLDELERTGEGRNLLTILVIGDNGASAESGNEGTLNELGKINGLQEDEAWLTANLDRMGGPLTYEAYPAGWAWAMNTPLRWTKQYTSMLGGIRNGMIMRYSDKGEQRAAAPGSVCPRFGHLVDIAPTVLEAAGLPAPETVNGIAQRAMDGKSLLSSLSHCEADHERTQYFEMGGKIGLWHDGWFLSKDDGRTPWMMVPPPGEPHAWELYNLDEDYSQAHNVSAQNPDRLKSMIALWQEEARRNQVFPLDHRFGFARAMGHRPPAKSEVEYWGKGVSVAAQTAPMFAGRSFTLTADIAPAGAQASGVVVGYGSRFAGWSLYLDKGHPVFTYAASTNPADIVTIRSSKRVTGDAPLVLRLETPGPRQGATLAIRSGDETLATGEVARTFLMPAGLGETLDLGRDLGVDVTDYPGGRDAFEGEIRHVAITLDPPPAPARPQANSGAVPEGHQ